MLTPKQQQRVRDTAGLFRERLAGALASTDQEVVAGARALAECGLRVAVAWGEIPEPPLGMPADEAFLRILRIIAESTTEDAAYGGAKLLGQLFEWEYRPATLTLAAGTGACRSAWHDYLTCRTDSLDEDAE